ncbi:MAG TPA: PEP-CTERM sorting domain-containing protein [Myxococcota bacterium]|jgi:hypothetical protein|nr:PEP-CTERM sorting domain-containing protein [Myxococcota bacterium]
MRRAAPFLSGLLLASVLALPGSASALSSSTSVAGGLSAFLNAIAAALSNITLTQSGSPPTTTINIPKLPPIVIPPRPKPPVSAVPEPAAFLAFGAGALIVGASLRRRIR